MTFFMIPIDTPYLRAVKNYRHSERKDSRCTLKDYNTPKYCKCSGCSYFNKHWEEWVYSKESYIHPITLPSLISALERGNYGRSTLNPVWRVGDYLYTISKNFVFYIKIPEGRTDHNSEIWLESLAEELTEFKNKQLVTLGV